MDLALATWQQLELEQISEGVGLVFQELVVVQVEVVALEHQEEVEEEGLLQQQIVTTTCDNNMH